MLECNRNFFKWHSRFFIFCCLFTIFLHIYLNRPCCFTPLPMPRLFLLLGCPLFLCSHNWQATIFLLQEMIQRSSLWNLSWVLPWKQKWSFSPLNMRTIVPVFITLIIYFYLILYLNVYPRKGTPFHLFISNAYAVL